MQRSAGELRLEESKYSSEWSSPPAVSGWCCRRALAQRRPVAARERRKESSSVSLRDVSATFPRYSSATDDGREENVQQRQCAKRIRECIQQILADPSIDDEPPNECRGNRDRCPENGRTLRRQEKDREGEGERWEELQQRRH